LKAESIQPTKFQEAALRYRGHCNVLNAGGRGSGKSFCLCLDLIDHCREFGADARPLVMRESHGGLLELQSEIFDLAVTAFGPTTTRNKNEGAIYLPGGGIITFTNIGDDTSYGKLQGRSFTGLFCDEVGNYPPTAFAFMRRVMSNLRTAPGRRPHIHWTANPHGRSHTVLFREFISKAPPWHPFTDKFGQLWVWTTSDLSMNPHIDRLTYERNLRASCGHDEALADAWIHGTWSVLGGVMFSNFDPAVHIIQPPAYFDAAYRIGGDWGSAAPATAILLARIKTQAGRLRYGDIIALDETDTADPNDLSAGLGHPPQMFAEMIKEMAARNGVVRPQLVMDDARGLQSETIVGIMRENRIAAWKPAKKDRTGTWALINQLLHNAKTGEGPALWFTNRCPHLLETLPEAPRGTLRPEDVDPKWQRDHWLDALGYGVRDLHTNRVKSSRLIGVPS